MHTQGLREYFLNDPPPGTRRSSELRDPIITPDAAEARGTHAGLWLDKYIVLQEKKDDTGGSQGRSATQKSSPEQKEDENSRTRLTREVATLPIPNIYGQFYQQWVQTLDKYNAHKRAAQVKGRMIVGLGTESVLETSIALHRTYGVPYIPGSALKGLAASYLRSQFGDQWRKDKTKLQQYKVIFGDTDEAGYIIFFDALYIPPKEDKKQRALYQDIITVHHPDYYSEKKDASGKKNASPKDWDNPNPIPFLSATGHYLIALAAPDLQERELWINATFGILDNALQHRGIGAKTSSGYGRMKFVSEEEASSDQQQEEVQHISPEAQQCIEKIRHIPKASFNQRIHDTYKDWQNFKDSEDCLAIARAIVEQIDQEGYKDAKSKKSWYQELVVFIAAEIGRK